MVGELSFDVQAQRGAEVFSREDTEGVREEVNAQMDAMTPHDGTANGDHLPDLRGQLSFPALQCYKSNHEIATGSGESTLSWPHLSLSNFLMTIIEKKSDRPYFQARAAFAACN